MSVKNDIRALHIVNPIIHLGYNVQIPYWAFTISLGADGEYTHVYYQDRGEPLFVIRGTGGDSIKAAINFIDEEIANASHDTFL